MIGGNDPIALPPSYLLYQLTVSAGGLKTGTYAVRSVSARSDDSKVRSLAANGTAEMRDLEQCSGTADRNEVYLRG